MVLWRVSLRLLIAVQRKSKIKVRSADHSYLQTHPTPETANNYSNPPLLIEYPCAFLIDKTVCRPRNVTVGAVGQLLLLCLVHVFQSQGCSLDDLLFFWVIYYNLWITIQPAPLSQSRWIQCCKFLVEIKMRFDQIYIFFLTRSK